MRSPHLVARTFKLCVWLADIDEESRFDSLPSHLSSKLDHWVGCVLLIILNNLLVGSEVPTGEAANRNDVSFDDPRELKSLEAMNHFFFDFSSANGFDGSQLRRDAPKRSRFVQMTKANTQERVEAIKSAKTAGQMFYAAGGQHLNSDDFFRFASLRKRSKEIEDMEASKAKHRKSLDEQKAAVQLIRKKGEPTDSSFKKITNKEIEALLKWKQVKGASKLKKDIVEACITAPKPPIAMILTGREEKALQDLKDAMMPLKETQLGVAAGQMARAVSGNVAQLDEEAVESLNSALKECESKDGGAPEQP